MASTGQNDDQVKDSDGGGLDGKKQVDDNSESSNLSFYEIRRRKIQRLAVLMKEADDLKKSMLASGELPNLSVYEIRSRKIQQLAVLKAKLKEADDLKKSMLASGELPTPNQTMSKIALPTTVTGKRKAAESCDMSKSAKLPKGNDVLHGKTAAEKGLDPELRAAYEKIMSKGRTLRQIKHAVGLRTKRTGN